MSKTVEFFFDFGSPASYLAWTQLPKLSASLGAELRYRPMLLGGVFQATGNASPISVPAKGRYTLIDFQRFARRYGVAFSLNPNFPINTLTLMRGACAYQLRAPDQFETYVKAMFEALWTRQRNLADPPWWPKRTDRGRTGCSGLRRLGGRGRGQGRAQGCHRGSCPARRVRCADLLRRRRDVLRPGPPGLRCRSPEPG